MVAMFIIIKIGVFSHSSFLLIDFINSSFFSFFLKSIHHVTIKDEVCAPVGGACDRGTRDHRMGEERFGKTTLQGFKGTPRTEEAHPNPQ